MEVKGRLWDSRRLGQSSGTYPLRLLAGDLCSFSFAPPPSPAGSQGLGPGRKGARERSTRSWGSGQEAAEEAGSGAGIQFHPCFPPRGEGKAGLCHWVAVEPGLGKAPGKDR